MDKVIEAMANIISREKLIGTHEQVAQALLNLRYDCDFCHGYSRSDSDNADSRADGCPTCNGTGNGGRMLYIGAQNQEPPKYDHSLYMISAQDVAWVQKSMMKVDRDGYAFRRVKVQEDNNETNNH